MHGTVIQVLQSNSRYIYVTRLSFAIVTLIVNSYSAINKRLGRAETLPPEI